MKTKRKLSSKDQGLVFLKRLGRHIAKTRANSGYSQDRLCLEGGLSRGTIYKLESGLLNPSVLTLRKIAKTMGVPIARLIDVD